MKTYFAKEIGEMFGISAKRVGMISKEHNIKVSRHGCWKKCYPQCGYMRVWNWMYYGMVIPVFDKILKR